MQLDTTRACVILRITVAGPGVFVGAGSPNASRTFFSRTHSRRKALSMSLLHPSTSRIDACVALATAGVQVLKAWDGRGAAGMDYSERFDNQFVLPPS